MTTEIFNGKEITIRKLSKNDLGKVKKFQDFINSLIEEGAKIIFNKKFSYQGKLIDEIVMLRRL